MIIHDCIQYEPDWWKLRQGIPTASEFNKIFTPVKGDLSKQSKQYLYELIAEPITGEDESHFNESDWVIRGKELEAEALDFLAFSRGIECERVGFITNDKGTAGCSPDAIRTWLSMHDKRQGIEIKCPKGSTHVGYLLNGGLPDYYKCQTHGSMYITGLPWLFVSYHPRFDPLIVEVTPDDYTKKIGEGLEKFIQELATAKKKIGVM